MTAVSALAFTVSTGLVGLALSADSGFDWGTDDSDDEYESPFGDDADAPQGDDDAVPPDDDFDWDVDESDGGAESASAGAPGETDSSASEGDAEPALAKRSDARALCDEAMDLLHAGEVARAFDRLSAHWAFSPDEMTQLQREVERTRAVVADRYGDALDVRLVREDTAGDVLACFVYLERFELHGLRWRFTVYEGANGWTLNDVFFDDEIEALLG